MVADLKNASEGVLKGMALFSNSWILYEYDELSRLSRRRVGEVLEEYYSYLPGSESGTTTTLPETYYTTAKGSSTKLSGYRYACDAVSYTHLDVYKRPKQHHADHRPEEQQLLVVRV